jgi:hypothetical protein
MAISAVTSKAFILVIIKFKNFPVLRYFNKGGRGTTSCPVTVLNPPLPIGSFVVKTLFIPPVFAVPRRQPDCYIQFIGYIRLEGLSTKQKIIPAILILKK